MLLDQKSKPALSAENLQQKIKDCKMAADF